MTIKPANPLGPRIGLQRNTRKPSDLGKSAELGQHGSVPRAWSGDRTGEARECCPCDRNQLRGRIQLHGRSQRNHRVGQAEVFVFQFFDVLHHLGFRAIPVEHRVAGNPWFWPSGQRTSHNSSPATLTKRRAQGCKSSALVRSFNDTPMCSPSA